MVIFWDIDGTLLTTARAGIRAWEDALRSTTRRDLDLTSLDTAGLIDPEIGRRLLVIAGVDPSPDRVRAICDAYAARLPARLGERRGHVMDGVRELLDALERRDDVRQYLLTGNLRACGLAKLRHYGITELSEGAFADDAADRAEVARAAYALATAALREDDLSGRVFVIGDTPHDVTCANAIGARAIGVATGPYSRDQLTAAGAWLALDRLPKPDEFLRAIGVTR